MQRAEERLRVTLPTDSEHTPSIRLIAREFAEQHAVARPIDVELAVGEACANVLMHAYRGAAAGPVHLSGAVGPALVYLTVADEGPGVAPRLESPGMGLGLAIIASATDRLRICRRTPVGAQVIMGFAIGGDARTPRPRATAQRRRRRRWSGDRGPR